MPSAFELCQSSDSIDHVVLYRLPYPIAAAYCSLLSQPRSERNEGVAYFIETVLHILSLFALAELRSLGHTQEVERMLREHLAQSGIGKCLGLLGKANRLMGPSATSSSSFCKTFLGLT
ncbi:MAG: hypothetical protein RBU37_19740 [Myxococcota bacterium]|jgi:hypothetical protein|nr:hypothetical protein [Myxococcota bacterium]